MQKLDHESYFDAEIAKYKNTMDMELAKYRMQLNFEKSKCHALENNFRMAFASVLADVWWQSKRDRL